MLKQDTVSTLCDIHCVLRSTTSFPTDLVDLACGYFGPLDFISVWRVEDGELYLPLQETGTYDFQVDWGDGHSDHVMEFQQNKHVYAQPGTYTLTISGKLQGFCFGEWNDLFLHRLCDRGKLLDISQWGMLQLGNSGAYFSLCYNFTASARDAPNLEKTTNLYRMFYCTMAFNGDLSQWDVSQVTDMKQMFQQATAFNGDLSQWDVSQVTDMKQMFQQATAFNGDLSQLERVAGNRYETDVSTGDGV